MEPLALIANLIECGLNAVLGTGTYGCAPFFKKIKSIWLHPADFEYDETRILDADYVLELQATGNLIVLNNVDTVTSQAAEDTLDTSEDGVEQIGNLGRYKFNFKFIKGLYNNAALHSLNGFGQFSVTFIDIDGNMLMTSPDGGTTLKGFTLGMHQADQLQWAGSGTSQKEGFTMQLLERAEVDKNYVFIQRQQLGVNFNPLVVQGINQVTLEFVSEPGDTDTTLTVRAFRTQDGRPFTGINYQQYRLRVDGTVGNPTAGNDNTTEGTFPLTVAALNTDEQLQLELYDNVEGRNVIVVDGRLYKSNVLTATVV